MRKVKTQPVRIDGGSSLLYMIAQDHAQRLVKKMGRAVVIGRKHPVIRIHFQRCFVSNLYHAL